MHAKLVNESVFKPKSEEEGIADLFANIQKETQKAIEKGSILDIRHAFIDNLDTLVKHVVLTQLDSKLKINFESFHGYFTSNWRNGGEYLGPKSTRKGIGIANLDNNLKILIALNNAGDGLIGVLLKEGSGNEYNKVNNKHKVISETSVNKNINDFVKKLEPFFDIGNKHVLKIKKGGGWPPRTMYILEDPDGQEIDRTWTISKYDTEIDDNMVKNYNEFLKKHNLSKNDISIIRK